MRVTCVAAFIAITLFPIVAGARHLRPHRGHETHTPNLSRKLRFLSPGIDRGDNDEDVLGRQGFLDGERNVGTNGNRRRRVPGFTTTTSTQQEEILDDPRVRSDLGSFVHGWIHPEEKCPASNDAKAICGDSYHDARNQLLQYCAIGVARGDCCSFLRAAKRSPEWKTFRGCVCSRHAACDMRPFFAIRMLFVACDIQLDGLPECN